MRQTLLNKITLSGLLLAAAGVFSTHAATPAAPQGAATAKEWLNLTAGVAIQELRDLATFPNTPDVVAYPQRLEWPTGPNDTTPPAGDVKNNYGVLIQGFIYPPLDGDYVFAIAADDNAEFWLSTDDKPANIAQICAEPTWNPVRQFSAVTRRNPDAPENVSAKIKLVKGKPYYFEALMKEGGGGDNLAVAWQKPGDALPPQNGDIPIPGKYLATIDKTFPSPEVLGSSANLFGVTFTVVEGAAGSATIDTASVKVTIDNGVATHAIAKDGSLSTISTTSTTPFASDSKHTANLSFKDSAGKAISSDLSFTTQHYASLTAADSVTADTTKKGFLWRVSQVNCCQPNNFTFTEAQLAGIAKDADGNVLANDAVAGAVGPAKGNGKVVGGGLLEFEIEGVINLSQTADTLIGNFQPDLAMPGIPDALDNIAAEIVTFIDMPAGFVQMGVNSDDGFRTTVNGANLGQFEGGRGATDTMFTIFVEKAGIYPFRTIYEEGGGDANIEWFTVNAGKKVLVNDTANGGLPAYRAAAAGAIIVKSVTPGAGAIEVGTAPNIGAIIDDGGAVDKASVKLNVLGKDVTAKVDQAGGTTTVSYTPSPDLDTATTVPVVLSFSSTAGGSRSVSWSFTTTILGKETIYIEAEDYNFDNGKTITDKNIGMNKTPYAGGDFKDLGTEADAEIDYHNPGGNAGQAYRSATGVAAGKENGSAGSFRGYFDVTSFWTVGWNDVGDWQNYTRTFPSPAQKYNVYGHVSSGGGPIDFTLEEVTSDPTKPDQTTKILAAIKPGRATAGWDVLEILPFTVDDGGQTPAVVELGGKVTLRVLMRSGAGDIDYMAFVPAKTGGGGGTPPTLSVAKTAGTVVITYEGVLQGSDTVNGTFADVPGAVSPFTADITKNAKYYKARR